MTDGIGPIRVLLLETEPDAAAHVREALAGDDRVHLVATVADQTSLLDKLGATYAQVAVVDLAGLRGDIGPAVREILSPPPDCSGIVPGAIVPPAPVSRAVTAAARGFPRKLYPAENPVTTTRKPSGILKE